MNKVDSLLIDSLSQRIDFFESQITDKLCHIDILDRQVADLHTQLSESQNFLSNAIASSDRFLSVASIAITIIAIALGVYITWCQNRVVKIKKIVEDKETEIQLLKKEVDSTNKQIQGDLSSLYKKLRREETVTLLNRLVQVPEDINNIARFLLIRDLEVEDFNQLNEAFAKIKNDKDYVIPYLIVLFQHFAGLSIKDEILRNLLIENYQYLIPNSFKNDIQKSTVDMVKELPSLAPDIRMQIIIPFYKNFKESKFKEMYYIVESLKSVLSEEQWKSVIAQTNEGEEEI